MALGKGSAAFRRGSIAGVGPSPSPHQHSNCPPPPPLPCAAPGNSPSFSAGPCEGDAGGPLVQAGSAVAGDVLVGVSSWGKPCGTGFPGAPHSWGVAVTATATALRLQLRLMDKGFSEDWAVGSLPPHPLPCPPCRSPLIAAVFTDVAALRPWVDGTVAALLASKWAGRGEEEARLLACMHACMQGRGGGLLGLLCWAGGLGWGVGRAGSLDRGPGGAARLGARCCAGPRCLPPPLPHHTTLTKPHACLFDAPRSERQHQAAVVWL